MPQSTADQGVGTRCCGSASEAANNSVLAREQDITEAEQCVRAELRGRDVPEVRENRPSPVSQARA